MLDTSAVFAVLDRSDANHRAGVRAVRALVGGARLVTTNYVAVESLSLVSRRLGMEAARTLQRTVLQTITMHVTSMLEHAAAVEQFLETGRAMSFVDCATMATMRARGIQRIFTFDDEFRRAGFDLVP